MNKEKLMTTGVPESPALPPDQECFDYSGVAMLVADWSVTPKKRVTYRVNVDQRTISKLDPSTPTGWTVRELCTQARKLTESPALGVRCCLVAIDVALGVPEGLFSEWAAKTSNPAHCRNLADYLRTSPPNAIEPAEAESAGSWSPQSPYIRVPPGSGSLRAFEGAAAACGVRLMRAVDELTGGKSPLILSGIPGTVGSGSRAVLRELVCSHLNDDWKSHIAIWPFDGPLQECMRSRGQVVLGEIYPRALYGHALSDEAPADRRSLVVAKTSRKVREAAIDLLQSLTWHRSGTTVMALSGKCLDRAVEDEDEFDAYLSALGLLRLALEGVSLEDASLRVGEGGPIIEAVSEGGMLGLLAGQAWNEHVRFSAGQSLRPRADVANRKSPAVWTTEAIMRNAHKAIVFSGLPSGTRDKRVIRTLQTEDGNRYLLAIGDHSMIWRAHQSGEDQVADFDTLFDRLAESPGDRVAVEVLEE